jgi:hypothetical protein
VVIFFFFDGGCGVELVEVVHAGFLRLERVLLLLQNLYVEDDGVKFFAIGLELGLLVLGFFA